MKKNLSLVFAVLLTLSLILSACQPAPTPVQTEAAVPEKTVEVVPPTEVEAPPTEAAVAPTEAVTAAPVETDRSRSSRGRWLVLRHEDRILPRWRARWPLRDRRL